MAADEAHNAALLALQKGNADEARRQFDISSKELERYHSADIAARKQDQSLASAKFGNDVYNKLADLASNPRNYMEQFFRMRGQTPPNGSAAYGNTPVNGPGLATFEQFLPQFLQSTGLAGGGYGYGGAPSGQQNLNMGGVQKGAPAATGQSFAGMPAGAKVVTSGLPDQTKPVSLSDWAMKNMPQLAGQAVTAGAPPAAGTGQQFGQGLNPTPGYGSSYSGLSGFDPVTNQPRLSPNDPDAAGLMAKNPGMYSMTSASEAQKYLPKQFAQGGSLTMTAPHAIINLLSGKVAAIAGEERGPGPQGFVPETAKFDGQALIKDPNDPSTPPAPGDPGFIGPVAPYQNPDFIGPVMPPGFIPAPPAPGDPGFIGPVLPAPTTQPPIDYAAQGAALAAAANASNPNLNPPPPPPPPVTPQWTQTTATPVPQPPQQPIQPNPIVQQPIQQQQQPIADQFVTPRQEATPMVYPQPQVPQGQSQAQIDAANAQAQAQSQAAAAAAEAARVAGLPSGITPGPVTTTAPNPGPAPAPVVTPTNIPNPSMGFDNLMNTPSGIGKNPSFLPEDQANQDPILKQMIDQGNFPPFLQRLFAQGKGLAGLGTNVPQQTDLPPGVPLISKLAYSQMTPAERSGFESYLSAHGLDLSTYLSLMEAASPQGGTSSGNPAIPTFLRQ